MHILTYFNLYLAGSERIIQVSVNIQNNDLSPIWNEHFEFVVEDESTQHLVVKIFDDEGIGASELIGCAMVRLSELQPGKVKDVWLKLVKSLEVQRDNKNRGQVRRLILSFKLLHIIMNYQLYYYLLLLVSHSSLGASSLTFLWTVL